MVLDYHETLVPNQTPYKSFQEHINRYDFASEFVRDKLVLDVACGVRYGSSYLRHQGAKRVVGGDITKDCLDYAKTHYLYGRGMFFVRLDATNLPFHNESFDIIVCLETIEHMQNYRKLLAECKRVLKVGGKFVCSTPNKQIFSPYTDVSVPVHIHEFYISEFYNLLSQYFVNITLYGQRFTEMRKVIMANLISHGSKTLSSLPRGTEIKKIIRKIIFSPWNEKEDPIAKLGIEIRTEIIDKDYSVKPYRKFFSIRTPGCLIATGDK